MKNNLIILLALLPISLFGQDLKCCESEKEVETYLSGIWTVKNSESNTVYKYWFEKRKGHLTEMERTETKGEFLIIDNHPFVEIIKYDQGFKLKYTHLHSHWMAALKYLNSSRLVLVTNGKEVEYIKVSE